jgi:glycosyltransferase involved in cell wall biosynthesis
MLIACYNVYNEAAYFEESLERIRKKVDYIIVVDGAYKKFPHNVPYSTDGTIEIAEKYADRIVETAYPWPSEIEKRNQYLIGKKGDTYLVMDGHEVWVGDLKRPFGDYKIRTVRSEGDCSFPKMFKHVEGIHYARKHYELYDKDNKLINNESWPEYQFGYLFHKEGYREDRLKAREEYYNKPNFDN